MASKLTLHIIFLTSSLLAFDALANEGNVLLTGDVLPAEGQLSAGSSAFAMQGDCNLVLYNDYRGFQSNTHGKGANCSLSLSDAGQLIVAARGWQVWKSWPAGAREGKYAAVLRPDGQVAVYGPAVWWTPQLHFRATMLDAEKVKIPKVRNILFSSQVLNEDTELSSRDYKFAVRNCSVVVEKDGAGVVWRSGSGSKRKNCNGRLGHGGELVVSDDKSRVLWTSNNGGDDGDYVLIMQINGQAVIYGPIVWSTMSN